MQVHALSAVHDGILPPVHPPCTPHAAPAAQPAPPPAEPPCPPAAQPTLFDVKISAVHLRYLVTALLMANFSWAAALQYSGRNQRSARLGIAVQSIVVLLGFWRAPAGVIMHERPLACWCWRRRSACCCCWLWCCAVLAAPCMDSLVWPTCVKSGADDEANLHRRGLMV